MKDSIYFSHDADARNDEKIIGLIMEHGMEGYGIFWSIIEMLRTATEHKMHLDYKRIAFALHVDDAKIKDVIHGFELFEFDTVFFWSESLMRRMNIKNMVSEERRKAAKSRWDKAKAIQLHSKSSANDMQVQCNKGKKESKKTNKEKGNTHKPPNGEYSAEFEKFWAAYPNKTGKKKCNDIWKREKPDLQKCLTTLEWQKKSDQWTRDNGKYIPHPQTWLNQGRWDDESPEVKRKPNTVHGMEIV